MAPKIFIFALNELKMRRTLCRNCRKIWEEPRDIPIEESTCPNCGEKVIKNEAH